jgi:hypothetical protein
MVDDIAGFTQQMGQRGVACAAVQDLGWGVLTTIALPGGGKLGVYEPRHARPSAAREGAPAKAGKAAKAGAGKGARRSKARAKPAKAAKPAKGRAKGKPKRRGR